MSYDERLSSFGRAAILNVLLLSTHPTNRISLLDVNINWFSDCHRQYNQPRFQSLMNSNEIKWIECPTHTIQYTVNVYGHTIGYLH